MNTNDHRDEEERLRGTVGGGKDTEIRVAPQIAHTHTHGGPEKDTRSSKVHYVKPCCVCGGQLVNIISLACIQSMVSKHAVDFFWGTH